MAYRAFFAIRNLRGPEGQPTNAIYGFIKMFERLRSLLKPEYAQVVWDGGLAAERLTLLPEYKAQRAPMPDDLAQQLDGIQAYLAAANVATGCHDGVEADDWIATIARQAVAAGLRVCIASQDKDFMQLVSEQVSLLNPADKTAQPWGREQVRVKTGVEPGQVVDWLSLVGDSVDNIKGAPGVGPKTASKWLEQYGTLEGCYEHLAELEPERLRETLRQAQPVLWRNRQLIRLNDALPLGFDPAQCATRAGQGEKLLALYRQWGFKGLAAAQAAEPAMGQGDLFGGPGGE